MVLQFFKWRGVNKVYCGRCENGERDQKIQQEECGEMDRCLVFEA